METLKKNMSNHSNKQWSRIVRCTGRGSYHQHEPCKSILKIEASDIMYSIINGAHLTDDTIYGFRCKECGCFTRLYSIFIPKMVKKQAKILV